MFGAYVKLRVEKELWESVVRATGVEEEPGSASGLFRAHMKLLKDSERLQRKLAESEEELGKARKEAERLEEKLSAERKAREEMRKELDSFWASYRKLKDDYKMILKSPIIEERVVIKENVAAIEALAKKRDALQKEVWELRSKLVEAERNQRAVEERLKAQEAVVQGWRQRHHAVLAVWNPGKPGDPPELRAQLLSSKEFYEWREQRGEFESRRGLAAGRYSVAPIEY